MEPNIHVDYGYNIHVGNHFYANFNCTILDVCEVESERTACWDQMYTSIQQLIR